MATSKAAFQEANLGTTAIRDLGLTIAGTDLERILHDFLDELERAGIRRVRPRFYLSTEWGVPFGTITIAIPFYLARRDLTDLHAQRFGLVEGNSRGDILRYLRHEMGHVINYAYQLYDKADWVKQFGSITQPYEEEYHPEPFSPRHVVHLPGWYAQKHPDEDWAETFAVWMTPGLDWRSDYVGRPVALAKLNYCDQTMAALKERDPLVTDTELDEEVGELAYSLDQYYHEAAPASAPFPPGLDGALRTIFEDLGPPEDASADRWLPAAALMRRLERNVQVNVYRWTGHFPERTRWLWRHLAERAERLHLVYPQEKEMQAVVALTTLATALAMNHVHHGTYLPSEKSGRAV
jgi:hypothetical protein